VLRHIKSANQHLGHVYLCKIEIADGFYRIWIRASDVPKLGVLFPNTNGKEYLVGCPLALPMCWTESPNIVMAASETITDLANTQLSTGTTFDLHPLEDQSEAPVPLTAPSANEAPLPVPAPDPNPVLRPEPLLCGGHPKGADCNRNPLALWDVYVVDFLGLVQGYARTWRRVKRALLHIMDTVLCPLDSGDSIHRQETASTKKMTKGDSAWGTVKVILGWIINTLDKTISLPAHRLALIRKILASISATQRHVSRKKWHQVLGDLRSMDLAIFAAIGLFSVLQDALKTRDGNRVRLTSHTHAFFRDFN
jgi:hypothetical protein